MSNSDQQLTSANGYNTNNMIFEPAMSGEIPDSNPKIKYQRISIKTRHDDGSIGDLIFRTAENPDTNFSFGVSENKSQETGKVNGWVYPICLWNKDGPTESEKSWVKTFDAVVERCKDLLIEQKEDLGKFDLDRNELKKLNPLYWKKEVTKDKNGKSTQTVVPGTGPTLYAKLIVSKKQDKILTQFYDMDTDIQANPLDLLGKYCHGRSAIKIESIFIGNKISLQVKLYEQEYKIVNSGMTRLLSRPKSDSRVLTKDVNVGSAPMGNDSDDEGSVDGSEEEVEVVTRNVKSVTPKQPVVKPKATKPKVARNKATS
jgi:hypothetical protein